MVSKCPPFQEFLLRLVLDCFPLPAFITVLQLAFCAGLVAVLKVAGKVEVRHPVCTIALCHAFFHRHLACLPIDLFRTPLKTEPRVVLWGPSSGFLSAAPRQRTSPIRLIPSGR